MGNNICDSITSEGEFIRIRGDMKSKSVQCNLEHNISAQQIKIVEISGNNKQLQIVSSEQIIRPKITKTQSLQGEFQFPTSRQQLKTLKLDPKTIQVSYFHAQKRQQPPTLHHKSAQHQLIKPQQQIKIKYKNYIIKCQRKYISYLTINNIQNQQQEEKKIEINGLVKVYKLIKVQKINLQGLIYQGEMRRSKFDGFGRLYKNDQLVYQGEFRNNLFDGWGITPEYQGQFRAGRYDGYGIYKQHQHMKTLLKNNQHLSHPQIPVSDQIITFYYQGYFQHGLYSGSGVLIKGIKWPLEKIKQIHEKSNILDFLDDQIENGIQLIKQYQAKQIYIGQFSNGYKHGYGRLFNEQLEFSGHFSHNFFHGEGTQYNRKDEGKKVIKGHFRMGKEVRNNSLWKCFGNG